MHDLVTVEPVVKGARAEALRYPQHVDQATHQCQHIHDDIEMERLWVSCAEFEPAQEKQESPEQGLEGEGLQTSSTALSCQRITDTAA